MNFKKFLNESKREVSVEDRKIAEDIEKSIKKTLTQKFLNDILNNAIKSKTSTSSEKFGESNIKFTRVVVVPGGKDMGLEGRVYVDVEVLPFLNPYISPLRSERGFKSIESMRRDIRAQVTKELIEVLRKQVSSQVKRVVEVKKRAWNDSVFISLTYE